MKTKQTKTTTTRRTKVERAEIKAKIGERVTFAIDEGGDVEIVRVRMASDGCIYPATRRWALAHLDALIPVELPDHLKIENWKPQPPKRTRRAAVTR